MRLVQLAYAALYIVTVIVFGVCALALASFAVIELVQALSPSSEQEIRARFDRVLEAIGLTTIAVASLELSQTVLEEEVQRKAVMSAPTRVRRFLSRFLVVLVVALVIEGLVMTLKALHEKPSDMLYSAALIIASGVLLASWGWFVRMNRYAEELEPQALEEAKAEDRKVQ